MIFFAKTFLCILNNLVVFHKLFLCSTNDSRPSFLACKHSFNLLIHSFTHLISFLSFLEVLWIFENTLIFNRFIWMRHFYYYKMIIFCYSFIYSVRCDYSTYKPCQNNADWSVKTCYRLKIFKIFKVEIFTLSNIEQLSNFPYTDFVASKWFQTIFLAYKHTLLTSCFIVLPSWFHFCHLMNFYDFLKIPYFHLISNR